MCHAAHVDDKDGDYGAAVERLATVDGWRTAYPLLDRAGRAALEAVIAGLAHPHPKVRQWCAALLDHHADARCLPGLVRLLDDPVAGVRRHALHSLGCQPCKPAPLAVDVVPLLLRRAAEDPSVRVRRAAAHLLGCQPPDARAADGLSAIAATAADAKLRRNAQWALAQHTSRAVHPQSCPLPAMQPSGS